MFTTTKNTFLKGILGHFNWLRITIGKEEMMMDGWMGGFGSFST